MDVAPPEVGFPIDKDMILVLKVHELLVGEFGAHPVMLKFLIDSQSVGRLDGHYEAEYELRSGKSLRFMCKQARRDMIFRVSLGKGELSYTVDLDRHISDDLMPRSIFDIRALIDQWLKA
jgi:hypothetical protein